MDFKRNKLLIIPFAIIVGLLSSCFFVPNEFVKYEFIEEIEIEDNNDDLEGYHRVKEYDSYFTNVSSDGNKNQNVFTQFGEQGRLKTSGDQKLLVVPVDFIDYKVDKLGVSQETYIDNLNRAFFGIERNNNYVSVSEYYNTSSYGKLRLDGKVVDKFYTFNAKISDIDKVHSSISDQNIPTFADDFLVSYLNENGKTSLDEFKIDPTKGSTKDNIAMYFIYTFPAEYAKVNTDFFWAFTFVNYPLSWSSYSFMNTKMGNPDAHTYIHETGHLLGLTDYYPTKAAPLGFKQFEPVYCLDMMDCSMGDQTAYSKMFLDWTKPYVVEESCEVTLNAFENTGDLLLLSSNWNNTPFDEYFLLELYTPTKLNRIDAKYGNSKARLPNNYAIKLYHVNASLAYFTKKPDGTKIYSKDCVKGSKHLSGLVDYKFDNNTDYTSTDNDYLYELMLKDGVDVGKYATIENLFRKGDKIKEISLDDEDITYTILVESIDYRSATLKITIKDKVVPQPE